MMSILIDELISSFEPDTKKTKTKYDQFLIYVYITFDKKIKSTNSKKVKDKYSKIRKTILSYIFSHKTEIIKKLR